MKPPGPDAIARRAARRARREAAEAETRRVCGPDVGELEPCPYGCGREPCVPSDCPADPSAPGTPYACCDCDRGQCVVCPYSVPCDGPGGCRAGVGRRCVRPSGHSGPLIFPHEIRYLRTDVIAIRQDPEGVARRAMEAHGTDGEAAWVRSLNSLAANITALERYGPVDPDLVQRYITLASTGPGATVQLVLPMAAEGVDDGAAAHQA